MEIFYQIRDQYGYGAIIADFDKEEFKKWIIKCENHGYYDVDNVDESYVEGVILFISENEEYEIPFYYACAHINEDESSFSLVTQTDFFELFSGN